MLFRSLGKINQWVNTSDHKARSIWTDKQEIEKKCMPHHISRNTIESAKYLWERLCQSKYPNGKQKDKKIITRGRNRKSIMAACVWAQDRDNDPKVIAKAFDLDTFLGNMKLRDALGTRLPPEPAMFKAGQTSNAIHEANRKPELHV